MICLNKTLYPSLINRYTLILDATEVNGIITSMLQMKFTSYMSNSGEQIPCVTQIIIVVKGNMKLPADWSLNLPHM